MEKKPIIVFDLDGTLVSTSEDLVDSLNYALQQQGISKIDVNSLSQYIGLGGQVMIEKALKKEGREIKRELVDKMLADFLEYYENHIPGKSHYFKGLIDSLQKLQKEGYIFAICTNKAEKTAIKLINCLNKQLDIVSPFAALAGGDTYSWKKPDARHIFSVIEAANGDPKQAIMVGDSAPDIMAAHAANIPSIVVSFGYSDVPVEELNADRIIDSYSELTPQLVETLLADSQIIKDN